MEKTRGQLNIRTSILTFAETLQGLPKDMLYSAGPAQPLGSHGWIGIDSMSTVRHVDYVHQLSSAPSIQHSTRLFRSTSLFYRFHLRPPSFVCSACQFHLPLPTIVCSAHQFHIWRFADTPHGVSVPLVHPSSAASVPLAPPAGVSPLRPGVRGRRSSCGRRALWAWRE